MSEIRVDALEAAVREFNLSLPAWAPFKRWGDLTLQERDQCLTRAVEILRAINVLRKLLEPNRRVLITTPVKKSRTRGTSIQVGMMIEENLMTDALLLLLSIVIVWTAVSFYHLLERQHKERMYRPRCIGGDGHPISINQPFMWRNDAEAVCMDCRTAMTEEMRVKLETWAKERERNRRFV